MVKNFRNKKNRKLSLIGSTSGFRAASASSGTWFRSWTASGSGLWRWSARWSRTRARLGSGFRARLGSGFRSRLGLASWSRTWAGTRSGFWSRSGLGSGTRFGSRLGPWPWPGSWAGTTSRFWSCRLWSGSWPVWETLIFLNFLKS